MLQKRWIGAVLAVSFGLGSILNPLLISGAANQNGFSGVNTTQNGVTVAPESIQTPIKTHTVGQKDRTLVSKPNENVAVNSTAPNQTGKSRSAGIMNQSGTGTNNAHRAASNTRTGLSNNQFQILVRVIKADEMKIPVGRDDTK